MKVAWCVFFLHALCKETIFILGYQLLRDFEQLLVEIDEIVVTSPPSAWLFVYDFAWFRRYYFLAFLAVVIFLLMVKLIFACNTFRFFLNDWSFNHTFLRTFGFYGDNWSSFTCLIIMQNIFTIIKILGNSYYRRRLIIRFFALKFAYLTLHFRDISQGKLLLLPWNNPTRWVSLFPFHEFFYRFRIRGIFNFYSSNRIV